MSGRGLTRPLTKSIRRNAMRLAQHRAYRSLSLELERLARTMLADTPEATVESVALELDSVDVAMVLVAVVPTPGSGVVPGR